MFSHDKIFLIVQHNVDILEVISHTAFKFDWPFSIFQTMVLAENQIYALRLLGNFMSKDGFLVFTCPNGDYLLSYLETKKDFSSRYDSNFFDNIYQTEHWLEPSHKEILKIFNSLGFDIIKSGYFNLPKTRYLIIKKLEVFVNKIPLIRSLFFKSQLIVAKKNPNSPLLKALNIFENSAPIIFFK